MKISIEFDGEDSRDDVLMFLNATEFFLALCEIDDLCRSRMKYNENVTDDEYRFLETIRESCHSIRGFQ